jgi:hypothetical protein
MESPMRQLRLQERDEMNCNICQRPTETTTCRTCHKAIIVWLTNIPNLQMLAADHIAPGRSGSGAASAERSIGVNVNALDYSMAIELLAILHSWESEIRSARQLTPPALLKKEPTTDAEVQATCTFHLAHLDWTMGQEWAGDFYSEVKELHSKGMAAAKQFVEQPRRIPCPTDECGKYVVIDAENLMSDVTCFGCKQSWTVLRLVALAMSNPTRKFFLDVEAIALWLGISQRQVYKIVKANNIERRGSLYDLAAVIANR